MIHLFGLSGRHDEVAGRRRLCDVRIVINSLPEQRGEGFRTLVAEVLMLNPAAPLFVLGVALFAAALLALAVADRARNPPAAALLRQRLRTGVRLYGALLGAVIFVNWLAVLLRA